MKKIALTWISCILAVICILLSTGCSDGYSGPLEFELSDDRTYYIVDGVADGENPISVTVPESYRGKPVKEIGRSAFSYEWNLTSVILPDTIEEIGSLAFEESSLEEITLPNGLQRIGSGAFSNTKIKKLIIPEGVTEFDSICSGSLVEEIEVKGDIKDWCFAKCSFLRTVTMTTNITEIPYRAFFQCGQLRYTIPESVTSIGAAAFNGALQQEEIVIPKSVTRIGGWAFANAGVEKIIFEDPNGWECYTLSYGVGMFGTKSKKSWEAIDASDPSKNAYHLMDSLYWTDAWRKIDAVE